MRAPDAHRIPVRAPKARFLASAGLALFVVLLAALGDARLNSGSDAGGKTATVDRIADGGLAGVDVGYWAEAHDPDGRHHPLIKTTRTDEGWIQVTSALMPVGAAPGARVGGSLGALWISIVSVPLGALAAARLARGLGAGQGWVAFVVIGALSPLAFYGMDQWEHAPALAAGLWAAALLSERPDARRAMLAGVVAGLAVALRREIGLFLLALAGAEVVSAAGRAHWFRAPRRMAAVIAGGGAVIVSTLALDRAVLGRTLGGRSADQVAGAGANIGDRLSDGLLTTFSQYSTLDPAELLIGCLTLVGVALAARGWRDGDDHIVRIGGAIAAISVVARLVAGTGFVPGAFAVLPLTAVVPFLAGRDGRRLAVISGVAVVLTIALQWTGSLNAQWGGRYLLLPAAVIAVVAATEIERRGWRHPAAVVALASTAAIASLGLVWHVERTNGIADSLSDIEAAIEPGDAVISTHPHFVREVGFAALDGAWLRADTLPDVSGAFAVAGDAGIERVQLLHSGRCQDAGCDRRWRSGPGDRAVVGWDSVAAVPIAWLGDDTWVLEEFTPS